MMSDANPDDDDQVQAIVIDALILPDTERTDFIHQACGGNMDLLKAVEMALQRADQESRSVDSTTRFAMDDSNVEATEDWRSRNPDPAVNAAIGGYRILQPLGHGGMGQVYLAEQTHPVRRRVAIKVIKTDTPCKEVLARFEAERQALAIMNHPHIAKVLDAGVTADGKPYFAMEFVKGIPITDFCEKNNLPVEQRIALLVQTCRAIQHAHQKGIIHRDIKPTNVLVSLSDEEPEVKVIDFGLAKALQESTSLTDRTLFTQFGQVLGTYEYMSPEQAEMSVTDIDTRTDVYSLGVLLFELLTGQTPLGKKRVRELPPLQLLESIREDEAPRPSSLLRQQAESKDIADESRRPELKRLDRLCRADLDWIALKALEKDRSRRYDGPAALADDLERFLHNEPILARPPSLLYRFNKSLRKHRFAYATASIVLVATVLVALSTWQYRKSQRLEQARRDFSERIETTELGPEMLLIENELDDLPSRDLQSELRSQLQKRIATQVNELIDPATLDESWDRIVLGLGQLTDADEKQRSLQRVDTVLELEYRRLLSELGLVDQQVDTEDATPSGGAPAPLQTVDPERLSASQLRAEYETFLEIVLAANHLLENLERVELLYSRLRRQDLRQKVARLIDANIQSKARQFLVASADQRAARATLGRKLERLQQVLGDSTLIRNLLNDPEFVAAFYPIDLTPYLSASYRESPRSSGIWLAEDRRICEIAETRLGREFFFSTSILDADKFFDSIFTVKTTSSPAKFLWQIRFKKTNDGKHVRTNVFYRETLVRSWVTAWSENRLPIAFEFNPTQLRINVGNQSIMIHRLFEDETESRLHFQFSSGTKFTEAQLAVSSNDPPIEENTIRAGDLAFLDGNLIAAQGIYQNCLAAGSVTDPEIVGFKVLLCQHRLRPSKETAQRLLSTVRALQFPTAIYAACELIGDRLLDDDLEMDPSITTCLSATTPGKFGEVSAAYSSILTIRFYEFLNRNQTFDRMMRFSPAKQRALKEFDNLIDRIGVYLPDEVVHASWLFLFNQSLAIDATDDAQRYMDLLHAKWGQMNAGRGNFATHFAWDAILRGDATRLIVQVRALDREIQLSNSRQASDAFRLWQARLFVAVGQANSNSRAMSVLREILDGNRQDMVHAEAALLMGLLLEQSGQKDQAQKIWRDAFEFCKQEEGLVRDLVFVLLGSLSSALDTEWFFQCVDKNIQQSFVIVNLVRTVPSSIKDNITSGIVGLYNTPSGRELAFKLASRQVGFAQYRLAPHIHGMTETVLRGAFSNAPEIHRSLIQDFIAEGIGFWRKGEIPDHVLLLLITAWVFPENAEEKGELDTAIESVPEPLQERLTYVFAHRLKQRKRPELYVKLLRRIGGTSNPALKEFVERELRSIEMPQEN